jgi:D-alanine-D-alanine ligase and related ATP-grasp enzymes
MLSRQGGKDLNPQPVQNMQNMIIMSKARELGIDCKLLLPGCEDFLELTYKDETIVINKSRSHKMTLMAGLLAKHKEVSNLLLRRAELPVPEDIVVSDMGEEARRFLVKHQLVTVKPLDLNRSIGVTIRVRAEEELADAIQKVQRYSPSIMLQRYVEGYDYRVLVIGDQVVGVLEYRPAYIVGDGYSTIEQLVQRMNDEQLRRNTADLSSSYQPIDMESSDIQHHLHQQGRAAHDIPANGEQVELYTLDNAAANSLSEVIADRTDHICISNAEAAIKAAQALQLDVAGVDIRCKRIDLPLIEENGAILEVNALPDLVDPHLFIQEAASDVITVYLNYLFQD